MEILNRKIVDLSNEVDQGQEAFTIIQTTNEKLKQQVAELTRKNEDQRNDNELKLEKIIGERDSLKKEWDES